MGGALGRHVRAGAQVVTYDGRLLPFSRLACSTLGSYFTPRAVGRDAFAISRVFLGGNGGLLDLTKLRVAAARQSKQALLVSSGPSRTSFFSLMRPIREGMHTGRGRGGHLESRTFIERQERDRSFEEARLLNTRRTRDRRVIAERATV